MSYLPSATPTDDASERAANLKASLAVAAILIALATGTVILWLWSRADEARGLLELPARERQELFEATRRTLQSVCVPKRRIVDLEDYCREQAIFIRRFPDCDAACEELAQHAGSQPTR